MIFNLKDNFKHTKLTDIPYQCQAIFINLLHSFYLSNTCMEATLPNAILSLIFYEISTIGVFIL